MSASKAELVALRVAAHLGLVIADARKRRQWTLRELAARTGLAASSIHAIEHGRPAEIATYAAIAAALDLELRLDMVDPRKRAASIRAEDPVHAAMGEMQATKLAGHGFPVAIDEPYQHFQFAGRADLLAWDLDRRALLHIENRTRFPNVQEAIGSYNAKRRYLPAVIAERLGLRGGFLSVTNVIVGLWSAEVLHSIRIRSASFRAVCPDGLADFEAWWAGAAPVPGTPTSCFVLFDPGSSTSSRRPPFISLESALPTIVRPRYRGYADAADALRRRGSG